MRLYPLFASVATGIVLLMGSCSSNEELDLTNPLLPDADFDASSFVSFVNPTSNQFLTRTEIATYEKLSAAGKWKEFDLSEYDGGDLPGPQALLVKEGKIYTPLVTFSCATGPTRISMAMLALGKAGKIDPTRIVLVDRKFTLSGHKLSINDEPLYVKNYKQGNLWLNALQGTLQNGEATEGSWLYSMKYTDVTPLPNFYTFDSVAAVYDWVLTAFREKFGEEVNLNNYLSGVILDQPMLTTSEIEDELQHYLDGKTHHIN